MPDEIPCEACGAACVLARSVKLRNWTALEIAEWKSPPALGPDYDQYVRNARYRRAFLCEPCYKALDSVDGTAEIGGKMWGIDGASRRGRAAVYTVAKYLAYQRKLAEQMGIDAR